MPRPTFDPGPLQVASQLGRYCDSDSILAHWAMETGRLIEWLSSQFFSMVISAIKLHCCRTWQNSLGFVTHRYYRNSFIVLHNTGFVTIHCVSFLAVSWSCLLPYSPVNCNNSARMKEAFSDANTHTLCESSVVYCKLFMLIESESTFCTFLETSCVVFALLQYAKWQPSAKFGSD